MTKRLREEAELDLPKTTGGLPDLEELILFTDRGGKQSPAVLLLDPKPSGKGMGEVTCFCFWRNGRLLVFVLLRRGGCLEESMGRTYVT
jgi:hypothetical protein